MTEVANESKRVEGGSIEEPVFPGLGQRECDDRISEN